MKLDLQRENLPRLPRSPARTHFVRGAGLAPSFGRSNVFACSSSARTACASELW